MISYEPLVSCMPSLAEVKAMYPDYEYYNCALSDNSYGIIIKEIAGEAGLSSSLDINKNYTYFGKNLDTSVKSSYKVPSTTISEEMKIWNQHKKDCRILKIDTQGTELSILKNGEELLKAGYFDVLMIEIMTIEKYKYSPPYLEILKFLDTCGFVIYNIHPIYREFKGKYSPVEILSYGQTTEFDFTFIHKTLSL